MNESRQNSESQICSIIINNQQCEQLTILGVKRSYNQKVTRHPYDGNFLKMMRWDSNGRYIMNIPFTGGVHEL